MKRTFSGVIAAAALTLAVAAPAIAAAPSVKASLSCETGESGILILEDIGPGPASEVMPAAAQWFKDNDCNPGTRTKTLVWDRIIIVT